MHKQYKVERKGEKQIIFKIMTLDQYVSRLRIGNYKNLSQHIWISLITERAPDRYPKKSASESLTGGS